MTPDLKILQGDVLDQLKQLPDNSVHCVVTSPPYWQLRDYQTGTWEGGDPACRHIKAELRKGVNLAASIHSTRGGAKKIANIDEITFGASCPKCGAVRIDKQIGLEGSIEEFVARLVAVFEEVKRVLHPSGVCFVNIGDSYAGGFRGGDVGKSGLEGSATYQEQNKLAKEAVGAGPRIGHRSGFKKERGPRLDTKHKASDGIKPKDRCLVPFRLAIALQDAGWWVRDVICWAKRAPVPESVLDRCTQSWEPILMLTKSRKYFWDTEAVKEPAGENTHAKGTKLAPPKESAGAAEGNGHSGWQAATAEVLSTRNLRNFWLLGPEPFAEAHFAVFPTEVPKRCILAATSAHGVCPQCLAPWRRVVAPSEKYKKVLDGNIGRNHVIGSGNEDNVIGSSGQARKGNQVCAEYVTLDWAVGCECEAGKPVPATVLDPFAGSGTTGKVALELGRSAILIDLNPKYCRLARRRCQVTPGLQLS